MAVELFVEVLVEELPALPFLKELKNFDSKWKSILKEYDILVESSFFYTPRRIVIYCKSFPTQTQDKVIEIYGPPVQVAFVNGDKNKELTPAGKAFLNKNKLAFKDLKFIKKQDKEVLFATTIQKGILTEEILADIVKQFLTSLHFGKQMRWGSVKESFIRPIRNIMIFLGDKFIEISAYGIFGKAHTQLHRDFGFQYQEIKNFSDYCLKLKHGGVILSQQERKEIILQEIRQLQEQNKIYIEVDATLLEEVVAITESPFVMLGSFEEYFLELPKEIIITSMKENQRYFAVYQDETMQELSHNFVMVSNSTNKQQMVILRGNEKVLRARLKDAMFFYHNDKKYGLDNSRLDQLIFIDGAGSMLDKVEREIQIAKVLLQIFNHQELLKLQEQILETIRLSKADLLSEVVYEFPNLQGIMGYYYALEMKKDLSIALGIKEQYLPMGESSCMPSTLLSSIVALAHKFDNILMLFSLGKIPTGSKDPFALRRAANGILRIILNTKLKFHLQKDLEILIRVLGYKNLDLNQIYLFFIERLDGILMLNPALLKSVLATNEAEICNIVAKVRALDKIFSTPQEDLIVTFKRVANILKTKTELKKIDEGLLIEDAEKKLFKHFIWIKKQNILDYTEKINLLCTLKSDLDRFFDEVMVNVKDPSLKNNRIQLIAHIYQEFLEIADIKEISFLKN